MTALQHTPSPETIQNRMVSDLIDKLEMQELDDTTKLRIEWFRFLLLPSSPTPSHTFESLFGRGNIDDEGKKELMKISLIWHCTSYQISWGYDTTHRNHYNFHNDPKNGVALVRAFSTAFERCKDQMGDAPVFDAIRRIKDEVDTILIPLDNLFGDDPNASLFFQSLPKMILKLAFDHHPTLLRSYLPFLGLLLYWCDSCPEVISYLSYNIHWMSDALIEHFNSIISRFIPSHTPLTFALVEKTVARSSVRWNLEAQLGKGHDGRSEIWKENFQNYKEEELEVGSNVLASKIELWNRLGGFLARIGEITPNKWEIGRDRVLSKINISFKHLVFSGEEGCDQKGYLMKFKGAGLKDLWGKVRDKLRSNATQIRRGIGGSFMEEEEEEEKMEQPLTYKDMPRQKVEIVNQILEGLHFLRLVEDDMGSLLSFLLNCPIQLEFLQVAQSSKSSKRKRSSSSSN
jgi:hypothetical protein